MFTPIYEHLSTIDHLSEEVGKLSTRLSKIEQTLNTTLTTMTAFTESMTQSFEEMKNTKSTEVPVSLCKTEAVKTIVKTAFNTGFLNTHPDYFPENEIIYTVSGEDGFAVLRLEVKIRDNQQLSALMNKLNQISGVFQVSRPAG